jgi:hypothetical protein
LGPYLSRLELQKLVVRVLQAQGCLLSLSRGGSERLAQVADMLLIRLSDRRRKLVGSSGETCCDVLGRLNDLRERADPVAI